MSIQDSKYLIDYLLEPKDNIDSTENIRANYFLQILIDSISIAADVPVSLLELDALNDLSSHIFAMKDNKSIQAIYKREYGEDKNLNEIIEKELKGESFDKFSTQLTKQSNDLFNYITSQINEKVGNDTALPSVEELGELESELLESIPSILEHESFSDIKEIRSQPIVEILLFLLPFIEGVIWRTKNSNPPIYHEIGRMEPLWQLLTLCWFYENREQLNIVPSDKNTTIEQAIGLPNWAITCFHLHAEQKKVLCVTPPFFQNGYSYNQYVFYARQGLVFKYCFLAYMSLFALDSADRPEAENLVAVLFRRSNIEKNHRDTYMVIFQRAWEIIKTITIGDMQLIDKLAHKDISLLGQWVVFLADMIPFFKKTIEEGHSNLKFSLAIKSAFSRKLNQQPRGFIAEISLNEIHISLVDNPEYESYKTFPAFKNKDIDERRPDEQIWYKAPNSTVNSKLEKRELNIKFCDTLERSRMHQLTLDSWKVELLSDWLQRHFGSKKDHSVGTMTRFLGDGGKYACRLLRELTRADIVVSIYKKDYCEEQSFLKIVSEDSDDPQILSLLNEHQHAMDTIRIIHKDDTKDHFLCYKSVYENRFIYEQTGSSDRPITQAYLDYREPQSVMILPLHMEHRLIGVIEIKGSQRHHFRWTHRLCLQQVASVIAPYFYRQHLLQSLSIISFLILKHRFSAKDVFGENSIDSGFFSDVCQELCQIFLSRTANIWLQSAQRSDKFVLSGHSDKSIFDNTKRGYDGNISFLFTNKNMGADVEKHFLLAFSELYDEQGISIKQNKIVINTPNLFKVGRFYADDKRETVYDNTKTEQGVIRLNQDWLELDPLGKRRNLFEKRNFQEIMAFPLTQWNENLMGYEVIGFVSLQNDRFSNFSQDWRHTIKLVNDQIVIALEQIGYINREEALIRKTMKRKKRLHSLLGKLRIMKKLRALSVLSLRE